jgi:hypothetical protein
MVYDRVVVTGFLLKLLWLLLLLLLPFVGLCKGLL